MESHGLVGRDNVLAQLAEFVTSTTDHSAALVGVAGTGLTTLLLATERMAADAGTRVVRIDAREGSHAALTAWPRNSATPPILSRRNPRGAGTTRTQPTSHRARCS